MSEVVLKDLPESWEWTKLGEVIIKIVGGGTPSKNTAKYWEGNIPWLTIKDMRTQRPADTIDHITQEAVDESSTNLIPADTVIMATRVGLGKVVRVPYATTINQDLKALITPPELDKSYLEYWLVLKAQYLGSIGSGTTVKGIRLEQVKGLDFPLAPAEQQKRIVAKIEELFSHIDAGIAALKKAKQLLKQYRQSVLKAAVTGELTKQWREDNKDKLEPASQLLERILQERRQKWETQQLEQFKAKGKVPKGDKWKGTYKAPEAPVIQDVPELASEWIYVRLDTLTDVKGGLTVDSGRKKEGTKSLPYLRVANVQRGFFDLTKMKEIDVPLDKVDEFLLKDRDILFNEGGDRDKLGRGWVWHEEVKICTYQNHVFRARPYSDEIISEFVSIFGNTYGQEYFIRQGKQTTNLASINKTKLSGFPVPLCSSKEMRISFSMMDEKISIIDRMSTSVEMQLVEAEKNKQSILASAFSGGLVEGLDSDSPADELLKQISRQHVLSAAREKLTKSRRPTRKKAKSMSKKKIIDVLKESSDALSPEKLFDLIGADGSSTDEVEEFYIELKEALADRHVVIEAVLDVNIKRGDLISYKVEA